MLNDSHIGTRQILIGMVAAVKKIITKSSNQEMAFVKFEDMSGSIEAVVFPKIFSQIHTILSPNIVLLVEGRIDKKDDRITLLLENAKQIDESQENRD